MAKFRPLLTNEPSAGAAQLGSWPLWFSDALELHRDAPPKRVGLSDIPVDVLARITAPRSPICGLSLDRPRLMGVLNVTPDSFSDGGQHNGLTQALRRASQMVARGADIIDIGGESTRPGADFVDDSEEIARTVPVVEHIRATNSDVALSIDTRKANVAEAAIKAGAQIFNDVSALTFDKNSLSLIGYAKPTVCLMHASGDPKTMQDNPEYDNVTLDVYDYLEQRVEACLQAGLTRNQIIIDPGIGFGKTTDHNLQLIRNLSVFHGLGCPILLGVSRKRFIGEVTETPNAADRGAGSVAVALHALGQGVQMIRAHDIGMHVQAMTMWHRMHREVL